MNSPFNSSYGFESSEGTVSRGLCILLKYHAAKLCRDDDEWKSWGLPYVKMCAVNLYLDNFCVQETRAEVLLEPVVSTDNMNAELTDELSWSVIRHNNEFFECIVRYLRQPELCEILKINIGIIMEKSFEMGNYDSRVRSIIRNIFYMLNLSQDFLFTLESLCTQYTGPYFNQADISLLGSAVTPHRSLQVCAVALSTGIVMYGIGNV